MCRIIVRVMALALDLNEHYNYTVNVEYSGGGNYLVVIIYQGNWTVKAKPLANLEYFVDRSGIWDCNFKAYVTLTDIETIFETYRAVSKGKKYLSPL